MTERSLSPLTFMAEASITPIQNPTDHPDIRYSIGQKTDGAVQALLEKENDAFRRAMAGAITISRNADMSLDVWWQELSTLPVTAGRVDFSYKNKMLWFLLTLFHKMGIIQ